MRFLDKVCIVTGGSSGIGLATATQMAAEGGKVIIVARNEQEGNEAVSKITANSGTAIFVKADVGIAANVKQCVETVIEKFGKVDVVVNNAAMMTFKPIIELEVEEWDQVQAVNLRSVFLFCKYVLPQMKNGSVVNISSVHGHQTTPNVLPYAASKGGMEALTRGLSREYTREKARFNCVAPGAVDTPMLWSNPNVKSGAEKVEGVIGKPEELAAAICFLASDESSYINGTTLVVDGGRLDIL